MINGERFLIKPYKKGKALGEFKQNVNKRKVFLHNIPHFWKNTQLFQLFNKFGVVEDAFICKNLKEAGSQYAKYHKKNKQSGRSIGFVVFKDMKITQEVCDMQTILFQNEVINVEPAMISKNEAKKLNKERKKESDYVSKNQKKEAEDDDDVEIYVKKRDLIPREESNLNEREDLPVEVEERHELQLVLDSEHEIPYKKVKKNFKKKLRNNPLIYGNKKINSGDNDSENHHKHKISQSQLIWKSDKKLQYIRNHWKEYKSYQASRPSTSKYFFHRKLFEFYPDDSPGNYRLNKIRKRGKKRLQMRAIRAAELLKQQHSGFPLGY